MFQIESKDNKTKARSGIIKTPHGEIKTPCFTPVATKASIKSLDMKDFKKTNSQVILANTCHLYLQPGLNVIEKFSGFGPFMNWRGPTITDSGGYQVSFLWSKDDQDRAKSVKITDDGAIFQSHIDGSKHLLTPEKSMEIQKILGADIIMAFDNPLGKDYSDKRKNEAFNRTLRWEERSFNHWKKIKSKQALFGVIQGEEDKDLRQKSLKFILELGFPGLAMGGESIGSDPVKTAQALDTIVDLLPDDKPLHALGLGGGPEGIFEAVARGVDTFDNTGITRMARTGILFLYPQDGGNRENKFRTDIAKAKYKDSRPPISLQCGCYTCQNFSKAYLNHLFLSHEMLGPRLATIHNITYINNLMSQIRSAIENGDFLDLKASYFEKAL